ncbi:Tad domain-containing protein [Novosphingobium sp.]|uniref:Tad domain-containing protein n=1 Tax=Novosphingobium sp. TaxID=1874826 RepID=UPI003B5275B0
MMTAIGMLTLTFAMGFVVDYSRAQTVQTQLNAIADSAVLMAVDPQMLYVKAPQPHDAAAAVFNSQAATLSGITNLQVAVNVLDGNGTGSLRSATVGYTAQSTNIFASLLGMPSLSISGIAAATAAQPPSLNFYVALDTSPSMLLPTTTTGISSLAGGAIWSGEKYFYGRSDGCDFACHATNMQVWNLGTYVIDNNKNAIYLTSSGSVPFYRVSCSSGTTYAVYDNNNVQVGTNGSILNSESYCTTTPASGPANNPVTLKYLPLNKTNIATNYVTVSVSFPDTWWLAQNYSVVNPGAAAITLRSDAATAAAASVIQTAWTAQQNLAAQQNLTAQNASVVYNMQFFTFNITPVAGSGASTSSSPIPLSTTSPFNAMTGVETLANSAFPDLGDNAPQIVCSGTCAYWTSTSITTNNHDTDFGAMLKGMTARLPNPGGTGLTTATPQSVVLIVTDGLEDTAAGTTALTTSDLALCTKIKAANTYNARIAILYTQYDPGTINYTANPSFNSTASNVVPNIAAALQSCSTQNSDGSYLFVTVAANGDIAAGLNQLFQSVVQSSYLAR